MASKSSRKSTASLSANKSTGEAPFPGSQRVETPTLICRDGSIYLLNNHKKRLITRDCPFPSGLTVKLPPTDRNYALKDRSGNPFQADLCRNCKQKYVVYRKGSECPNSGCTENATLIMIRSSEVRECNIRIRKRFAKGEADLTHDREGEGGPKRFSETSPARGRTRRKRRVSVSSAETHLILNRPR